MKKNKTKLSLIFSLMSIFILLFAFYFSCFNIKNNLKLETQNQNNNFIENTLDPKSTDENAPNENSKFTPEKTTNTSVVRVGEIWDDVDKKFKATELTQLMRYASNTTASVEDLSAINNLLAGDKRVRANDMRGFNSNKDIIVKLGGLEWTATYLSKDKNGNPILTLWLINSTQLAGKPVYSNGGSPSRVPTITTFSAGGTATWNSGFSPSNNPNVSAPDAMYGTSYMRAVVLNNGGRYSITTGGGSDINGTAFMSATKKNDSVFSPFTVTTKELTGSTTNKTRIADHLVAPVNVSWQEYQSYKEVKVDPTYLYNLPNEGWVNGQDSNTYYQNSEGTNNYSNKTNYGVWKDDLIWLPSFTETGWHDGDRIGLWSTNTNQRSNPNDFSWLRSGSPVHAYYPFELDPTGTSTGTHLVSSSWAVRPALHINLTTASNSVSKDLWTNGKFNSSNLNKSLKHLAGSDTTTTNGDLLSKIDKQIVASGGKLDASQIKVNANKLTNKILLNADNELVIHFGGLNWYAVYLSKKYETSRDIILTLYLTDSGQLYNTNYINSSGVVTKFNQYGGASWNGGGTTYNSPTDEYPIYSTSFMRQNILNNKYDTTDSHYSTQSVFSLFTKSSFTDNTLADYIMPPCEVPYQNGQSAKNTLAFRYNLINEVPNNLNNLSYTYSFLKNAALNSTTYNELNNASVLNGNSSSTAQNDISKSVQNDRLGGFQNEKVDGVQNDRVGGGVMLSSNNVMLTNSICHAEQSQTSYNNVILSASEESIPITLNAPIMYSAVGTADTQTTLALNILESYDLWQYDRLWLPSLTETGGGEKVGLWKLSNAQRKNTNGTASWLRSGHITDKNSVYTLTADGTNYGYTAVNTQNGIRPALHLNLTLACRYAI